MPQMLEQSLKGRVVNCQIHSLESSRMDKQAHKLADSIFKNSRVFKLKIKLDPILAVLGTSIGGRAFGGSGQRKAHLGH